MEDHLNIIAYNRIRLVKSVNIEARKRKYKKKWMHNSMEYF